MTAPAVPPGTEAAPRVRVPWPNPPQPWFKRLVVWLLRRYMEVWHKIAVHGYENIPPIGPALVLTNHASLLDVPLLMAVDPYPNSVIVAKASLFRVPVVRQVLGAWGAIPVDRRGRDLAGIRAVLGHLRSGGVVAIAAEGRRSRSGRLEPINPVLARLAVSAGAPIIPVGLAGSYAALPPGTVLPRRRKIVAQLGRPFTFDRRTSVEEAQRRIQEEIAALLPPEQQPLPAAAQ